MSEESRPLRRVVALMIASAVRVDPKWFWKKKCIAALGGR
jgi:hypothetical protein